MSTRDIDDIRSDVMEAINDAFDAGARSRDAEVAALRSERDAWRRSYEALEKDRTELARLSRPR